jgi:hypothetical protein
MTPAIVIEERWPIAWIRYRATPTDLDVEELLGRYEGFYRNNPKPYAIAIATAPGARQTAAQNKRTGLWMKEHREHYEGRLRAMAFVSNSAVMRFALSSIFLLQPLTVPYRVVGTDDEADAFLRPLTT